LAALLAAAIIIGLISLTVHRGNKLFITNRRVIQMVMTSPVVNSVNIIDLSSVEDASFRQENLLQSLFHYGTLRLSTVGDETTYTFKYSDIKLSSKEINDNEILTVSFKVKNTGKVDGAEVCQLYVAPPESKIFKAPKELKGFKKVFLKQAKKRLFKLNLVSAVLLSIM
jgi:hypothetical protein